MYMFMQQNPRDRYTMCYFVTEILQATYRPDNNQNTTNILSEGTISRQNLWHIPQLIHYVTLHTAYYTLLKLPTLNSEKSELTRQKFIKFSAVSTTFWLLYIYERNTGSQNWGYSIQNTLRQRKYCSSKRIINVLNSLFSSVIAFKNRLD